MTDNKQGEANSVYKTYVQHYNTARAFVEAEPTEQSAVVAFMFTALMLEAYINHLGEYELQIWTRAEERKFGLEGKLRKIHADLGLVFNATDTKEKTAIDVIKRRNHIAHSRSVRQHYTFIPVDREESGSVLAFVPFDKEPDDPEAKFFKVAVDEFSSAVVNRYNPDMEKSVSAFYAIVNYIKFLDRKAMMHIHGEVPPVYDNPFSGIVHTHFSENFFD